MKNKVLNTIPVAFGESEYDIVIGRNIIGSIVDFLNSNTKDKKVLIVSDSFFDDSITKQLSEDMSAAGYNVFLYSFNGGKDNKNFNELLKIYAILEENDLARDSTLIAIGGGVIGDLAGFIASTWYRGMSLIHVPTTLMAMVDSSIGGKVAVNFRDTINAIGNYYHPRLNIIDLDLIDTLSDRDYRSGIAEVIKVAVINDKNFFNYLQENSDVILARKEDDVVKFVSRAIEIKIDHVSGDVREGSKRLLLNYGHTLGHAIEISTVVNDRESYRHGEGVSIGIMAALNIGRVHIGMDEEAINKVEDLFKMYDLPTFVDSKLLGLERESLLDKCTRNVQKDKKRKDNKLRVVLADKIGAASVYHDIPFELIEKTFEHIVR